MRRLVLLMITGLVAFTSSASAQEEFWFTPKFSDEEGCDRFMATPYVVVVANGEVVYDGHALPTMMKSGWCLWLVNNLPDDDIWVSVVIGEPDSYGRTEPGMRPGNFRWEAHLEAGYGDLSHELLMVEMLHLTTPFDNENPFPSWPYPKVRTEVEFSWEPAVDADYYKVWAGCMTKKKSGGFFYDDHFQGTSITVSDFPAGRQSGCSFDVDAIVTGTDGSEITTGSIYAVYGDNIFSDFRFGISPLGTTVITHGFQPPPAQVPTWAYSMAQKIKERAEGGRIRVYNKETGQFDLCPTENEFCDASSDGEEILIFDWAAESNDFGVGYSEAAAEALTASLLEEKSTGRIFLNPLHLIGHSRGTVVNSEVSERLVALGYDVYQVTALDPHDWGAFGDLELSNDFDVNTAHSQYPKNNRDLYTDEISSIISWEGVFYADTYWEDEASVCGREIPGTANLHLDFGDVGINPIKEHSLVHSFYHFTIPVFEPGTNGEPIDDGGGGEYVDTWYGEEDYCRMFSNPVERAQESGEAMERLYEGFGMTLIAQASWCGPEYGYPFPKTPVQFDFSLPEGIVNGGFEKGTKAGWELHQDQTSNGGRVCRISSPFGCPSAAPHTSDWVGELTWQDVLPPLGVATLRHNRFFIPPHAEGIRFCRMIDYVGNVPNDRFEVWLEEPNNAPTGRNIFGEEITGTTSWECFEEPLRPDELGQVRQFLFQVTAGEHDSQTVHPRIYVDDVSFILNTIGDGSSIFADDFESGNTSEWSSSTP